MASVQAIHYRGRLVAVATSRQVFLAPEVQALPAGHPHVRMVALMCLYARDVASGDLPGPFDQARAELFARCVLIDDDEFARLAGLPDPALARHFRVPVEHFAAKRLDLGTG
jgi:hypothetical protein